MGSKYQSAGVYSERLSGGALPVPGVGTATLVVAGYYTNGPDDKVEVITSWSEFERKYGGLSVESDNGFSVKGFFENGGQRVVPFRITSSAVAASDTSAFAGWTVSALYKGAVYNDYTVARTVNEDTTSNYDITVKNADAEEVEVFRSVTFVTADSDSADYVTNKVNAYSNLIKFTGAGAVSGAGTSTLANGSDGSALSNSNMVTAFTTGSCNVDAIEDENLLIVAPDFQNVTVTNQLVTYADARSDCFVIYSAQATDDIPSEAVTYRKTVTVSQASAMYWPYVKVYDVLRRVPRAIAPVGHVAGIYARTDSNKNVGKTPAGIIDGALKGIIALAYETKLGERDTLYQNRVNPLISSSATGIAVWGGRTTSVDPEWIYINHERLFQFVEKALTKATQWIVFENNTDSTRVRAYGQVYGALQSWTVENYFGSQIPKEAFFVQCDRNNNPEYIAQNGELVIDVGIAPGKPGEFVRIKIKQKTLSQ